MYNRVGFINYIKDNILDFNKRFPDVDQASSVLELADDFGIDLTYRKARKNN